MCGVVPLALHVFELPSCVLGVDAVLVAAALKDLDKGCAAHTYHARPDNLSVLFTVGFDGVHSLLRG